MLCHILYSFIHSFMSFLRRSQEDGTATAGEDYEKAAGTVTFADGESVQPIHVKIFDDDAVEEDEQFKVKLHNCSDPAVQIGTDSADVTIVDDDEPGEWNR